MIHFTHPEALLLLPLVPLLAWWWLRRRRVGLRFPGVDRVAGVPGGRGRVARWGGALLRGAALALLVVALSGPRWPDRRTRISADGIAIVVLLDTSGSMAERDFDWQGEPVSRLDAAKRAFRLFVSGGDGPDGQRLEGRPEDLVGLVTFGARPDSPCPLTLSHSVLLGLLDEQRPQSVPGESETNISDALVLGLHRLHAAGPRRRVLVLLSDGEHNVHTPRSDWTPRQAAQVAANLGVSVHAIDAGGELRAAADSTAAENRAAGARALQEVARITGGRYFAARDTAALLAVCREIDRLERQRIQSFQYRRYYEGYPWFALASFVSLVTALALETTRWRRLP